MNQLKAFALGARHLARAYTKDRASYGIREEDWDLITRDEFWSPDERRRVRSVLTELVQISLTVSGLPATRLPGQFAAALIVEVVHPSNVIVACHCAPDSYDAVNASGLSQEVEITAMQPEQILSLAMAFLAGQYDEPAQTLLEVHQYPDNSQSSSPKKG